MTFHVSSHAHCRFVIPGVCGGCSVNRRSVETAVGNKGCNISVRHCVLACVILSRSIFILFFLTELDSSDQVRSSSDKRTLMSACFTCA